MDKLCIHKQLDAFSSPDTWKVAAISDDSSGALTLTLQKEDLSARLTVEEGNLELGSFYKTQQARFYFGDDQQLEIDDGLHDAVVAIAERIEPCFAAPQSAVEGSSLGLFGFYLPLTLLAAALLAAAPVMLKNGFSAPPRALLKKAAINLALLFCGTALALGFAEMLVRISQINPAAPDYLASENGRYHMIPQGENELQLPRDYYQVEQVGGESFWFAKEQYRPQLGRRGSPPLLEEGSGLRLLAVGDSILFGSGVAEEDTFIRLAETLFRTRHPEARAEFVNLSQPGWNFAQYKIALRRWIGAVSPRVVLLAFWKGDIKNVTVQNGSVVPAEAVFSGDALLSPRFPLRLEDQRLLAKKSRFCALLFSVFSTPEDEPQRISDQNKLHSDFLEVLQIVRTAGARPVFLLLPQLDVPFDKQKVVHGSEVYELLKSWVASESDAMLLDPAPFLVGRDATALRRDYCHFNEAGHELMSRYIADELEKYLP